MMAQTGAFIVLSRLPSDRCGLSRSLASRDLTKRKRAGLQLAEVGPSFSEIDDAHAAARRGRPGRARHYGCAPRETAGRDRIRASLSAQTGRTSCTSGMKCRSRFSMPWRSVAVELGQPEQAPRICKIDHAVAIALEGDVAAVLGHGRAHARLEQLLDGLDRLLVLGRVELASLGAFRPARLALGDRLAREVVLHDGAENGGLQMLPLALALGHADEVGAEEHALDAVDLEQPRGERRGLARRWDRGIPACPGRARAGPG